MAKPIILVVDDEHASLKALTGEPERGTAHYRIMPSASADEALVQLAQLQAEGGSVPAILADQWIPD